MIKEIIIGAFVGLTIRGTILGIKKSKTKVKIKGLGIILCKRCAYKGKPIVSADDFNKIICPACNSEDWERVEECKL